MKKKIISTSYNNLFDRVVSIFEQYCTNTVRAINSHMVTAYWLIVEKHQFHTTVSDINMHLKSIYNEGEIQEQSIVKDFK